MRWGGRSGREPPGAAPAGPGPGMSAPALLLAAAVLSQAPLVPPCDAACERAAGVEALDRGDPRGAIARLKDAVEAHPDDPVLPLLLARAYLLDGNLFWAERALRASLECRPSDTAARAWLAAVHLRQGDPDLAGEELAAGPAPPDGPERSRRALLEAYRALLATEPAAARAALDGLRRSTTLFPEDRPVLRSLEQRLDPWSLEQVSGEVELAGGRTSNALAGAPTDPGVSGAGSGVGDATLRVRLSPGPRLMVRPVLDLELIGHGLEERESRELSSLQGSGRLGALVTSGRFRLLLGYRAEALHLDQDPSLFSEAHRGELEVETTGGLLAFAGAGRRVYRDDARTRREWDAGLGGPVRLGGRASMAVGATVRGSTAHVPVYDQRAVSLAAALRVGLGPRLSGRLAVTGSREDYPSSGGPDGERYFGTTERRRDLVGKATLGLWFAAGRRWRVGADWLVARRDSTADRRPGFDFDYRESRVRLLLRLTFSASPFGPRAVRPPDHVPLEWGIEPGEGSETERIIDLLRQDEELRRGSSCGI
jgi:tetratricopeptide (TPR) repeat protein